MSCLLRTVVDGVCVAPRVCWVCVSAGDVPRVPSEVAMGSDARADA